MTCVLRPCRRAAFTLAEIAVTMGVLAIALSAVFVLSGRVSNVLRASRISISAGQVLQERVEQTRALNWTQITSTSGLESADLLGSATASGADLRDYSETISVSVSPVPASAPAPRLTVTRKIDSVGQATLSTEAVESASFAQANAVEAVQTVVWQAFGRERTLSATTTIFNGGVTR